MRAYARSSKDQRLPRIGDLRERILLMYRTRRPVEGYRFEETMTPIGKVWARVTNLVGMSWGGGASGTEDAALTHEFLIRRAPAQYDNQAFDGVYVLHRGFRYKVSALWEYDLERRFVGLLCYVENREGGPLEQAYGLATEGGDELILEP